MTPKIIYHDSFYYNATLSKLGNAAANASHRCAHGEAAATHSQTVPPRNSRSPLGGVTTAKMGEGRTDGGLNARGRRPGGVNQGDGDGGHPWGDLWPLFCSSCQPACYLLPVCLFDP